MWGIMVDIPRMRINNTSAVNFVEEIEYKVFQKMYPILNLKFD